MRKKCAFLLSAAFVAAACGGSGNTVSEPSAEDSRPADSVPETAPVSGPEPAVTEPAVTEPPVTEPPVTEPPISADLITITSDDGDLFITLPGRVDPSPRLF